MFFRLFILFTVVPVLELALLIKLGTVIGALNTVAIVILTAAVGACLVRMEGIGVIRRFRQNMMEGIFPTEELVDGAMILVAGALLLTPGILTDVIGFLLVFPASRHVIKRFMKAYIRERISSMDVTIRRF